MPLKSKICRTLAVMVILFALSSAGFVAHLAARHNFHSVAAGRLYRSGQLDGNSLAEVIREQGIKTVVNLRGKYSGTDWYDDEISTARRFGVRHFDFNLSASSEVTDEQMERILATIEHSPKPVLIHCKNGADRSGLVGALYLYGVERQSAGDAGHQLAFFWGHIPFLFWHDTVAMDRSYWRYVSHHAPKAYPDMADIPD
jgi:protein tyrosine phosphatase (PTP) superfamily phosphohydrolase (DUF442 family)